MCTLEEEGRASGPEGTESVPQCVTPHDNPFQCHVRGVCSREEGKGRGMGQRGGAGQRGGERRTGKGMKKDKLVIALWVRTCSNVCMYVVACCSNRTVVMATAHEE